MHAVLEDLDDVGVAELRRRLGLALEPRDEVRRADERRRHELEGDRDVELLVVRDPDGAHAALGERPLQPELAGNDGSGKEVHSRRILHGGPARR